MNEEQDTPDTTEPNGLEPNKRPIAISIICIVGFIGAALSLVLVFSPTASSIGGWYPPYLGLTVLIGLACFIGIWRMKKIAAYVYIGMFLLNQPIMMLTGIWNITALLIPGVISGVLLYYRKSMN